tara:strand:- start:192 stop:755 length:564 start_codon:yes stop_codon:yes gene_type:complete
MAGQIRTYRFKLSGAVQDLVAEFARENAPLSRQDYKAAWEVWLETNSALIERERSRLKEQGFQGDLGVKMYKSGRYYFRCGRPKPAAEAADGKRVRRHTRTSQNLRARMDEHIAASFDLPEFRPSLGYKRFAEQFATLIKEESRRLGSVHSLPDSDIAVKLKRTYKNRFFLMRTRLLEAEGAPADEA